MPRLVSNPADPNLQSGPCWAILDSTDKIRIVQHLKDMEIEHVSLYKGDAMERYWDIAPYLTRIDQPLLDWLQENYRDRAWGITFTSSADLETLRAHFRKFLLVQDMQGRNLYFRFYDPRVLNAFLPRCLPNELPPFFGPVKEYKALLPKASQARAFSLAD